MSLSLLSILPLSPSSFSPVSLSPVSLSGEIPAQLGALSNLTKLNLRRNQLSGEYYAYFFMDATISDLLAD